MNYIIGIIAMLFGFISLIIKNYDVAFACFGFAFILWCVLGICEYKEKSEKTEETE